MHECNGILGIHCHDVVNSSYLYMTCTCETHCETHYISDFDQGKQRTLEVSSPSMQLDTCEAAIQQRINRTVQFFADMQP